MIKTFKVKLRPTKVQNSRFRQFAGASRFAYNWYLSYQDNFKVTNGIYDNPLAVRKAFTVAKKTSMLTWTNDISNDVLKQGLKDAVTAFDRFKKRQSGKPTFQKRSNSFGSFYIDTNKISFNNGKVQLTKIGTRKQNWVVLAEKHRIPVGPGIKYTNPRVVYDGVDWYITVGVETSVPTSKAVSDGIGIDMGLTTLATISDGTKIDQAVKVNSRLRRLQERKIALQKVISNKYECNSYSDDSDKKRFKSTSNIRTQQKKLRVLQKKINNIRNDYYHKTSTSIVNRNPRFISVETLSVKTMMQNSILAASFQEAAISKFIGLLKSKAEAKAITIIEANKFYASSKTCSQCGNVHDDLKLSDRVYNCIKCNLIIDRDLNAAINLKNLGI